MKKKPVILIDQDDVLAEYIEGVTAVFNERYGTNFTKADCIRWELETVFGERIYEVMHEPDLFRRLKPVPDAIEVLERIYKSEMADIYIVTAAHPETVAAKHEWIKEHLPFFPLNHVIICSKKYMVKGDYLLDDGMHNIVDFEKAGGKGIVFNRNHNQHIVGGYKRVDNWLTFEQWIREELGE